MISIFLGLEGASGPMWVVYERAHLPTLTCASSYSFPLKEKQIQS